MKATPITQKAKSTGRANNCSCGILNCGCSSSPAKANMALIYGAADVGASKSFVDPGKAMQPGLDKAMDKIGNGSVGYGKKEKEDDAELPTDE